MKKTIIAASYFKNSFNCSQSVFCAFAPEMGLSKNVSLKIACAFGAGMARQQLTCGAVTGALMAIGLKFGKGLNDDEMKKNETYEKSLRMIQNFKKKHQYISCKELLGGLDMATEMAKIKELGLFENKCRQYVEDAVTLTEELFNEK